MHEAELGGLLEVLIDHRGKTPKKMGGIDFTESGVPVISAIHIKNGRINWEERRRFVPYWMFKRWMPIRLRRGDVLLTSEAATFGEIAQVESDDDLVLSQRLFALRGKDGVLDSTYLRYFLQSREGQERLLHRTSGTAVIGIRQSELVKVRIPLPPFDEQLRIAGVLRTLDDLVDVNRLEAERLDALCRCLGQQFLNALVDRPLARIDELATVRKGYSYKSSELKAGNGWLVNLKNVGRDGQYLPLGLKPLTGNHKPLHVVSNGDVCVAQTDLTQKREVIGRPIRVRRGTATGDLIASLDLVIVCPRPQSTREYLFAVLDSDEFRSHALGFCNGTTVVHMASGAVPSFRAPVPKENELRTFSDRVTVLRTAADAALMHADQLESTRNELLPLLLSGRARVEEVSA
jgi:type I restriction enzyme S subunit